jgi:hypothetical protein
VGSITDAAAASPAFIALAEKLSQTPDALGMKLGILVGMLFPLFAIPVYHRILKTKNPK